MNPAKTWSVKGIDSSTREAAKRAAQERGMTLGQWLNETIRRQASEAPLNDGAAHAPSAGGEGDISRKLDILAEELRALVRREQNTAVDRFAAPAAPGGAIHADIISRIEHNEALTTRALEAMEARLDQLSEALERATGNGASGPAAAELETALRNVMDHLEASETRTSEVLGTIQERLANISAQAERAMKMAAEKGQQEDSQAIADLESRLEEMNARLADMQARAEENLRASVREEVSNNMQALAERVDAVHAASQSLPERVESLVGEVAGNKLGEVESRIEAMVFQLRGKLEEMASGIIDVDGIGARVDELSRKLDEVARQAVSSGEVEAMRNALSQLSAAVDDKAGRDELRKLSEVVDGKAGRDELAIFEQRLEETISRLSAERDEGGHLPQLSALENRVMELERQLREHSAEGMGDTVTLLQNGIGAIESRLKEAEQRLSQLPMLEDSIARLDKALEESAGATRKAAEETAMRLLADAPSRGAGGDSAQADEIKALKDGMEAIRNAAAASDARTQETLSAVHETLAHIIDKINALENSAGKPADAAAAPEAASGASAGAGMAGAAAAAATTATMAAAMPEASPSPVNEPAAAAPLDGQVNKPQDSQAGSAMAAAASTTAFTASAAPGAPDAGSSPASGKDKSSAGEASADNVIKEDFIAAARRAALAASGELDSGDEEDEKGGGFFSCLRGRGKKPPQEPSEPSMPQSGQDLPGSPPSGRQLKGEEEKEEKGAGLFSLSFLKRGKSDDKDADKGNDKLALAAAAPGEEEKDAGDAAGRRRRLVLMGAVLLAAVSALVARGVIVKSPAPGNHAPVVAPAPKKAKSGTVSGRVNKVAPRPAAPKAGSAHPGAGKAAQGKAAPGKAAGEKHSALSTAASGLTTASIGKLAATGSNLPGVIPASIGTPALRMAASSGDPRAQFLVATHYLRGQGVKRDLASAARWYEQAASKGLAVAQYRMGTLYERGRGVERDILKARNWYEKAARSGNVKAMHNLAVILASGNDSSEYAEAAKWFRSAARHGLRDSIYNLAVLYHRGMGVKKNLAEAYRWYSIAARSGDADAAQRRDGLKPHLEAAQRAAIDREVAAWKPLKADRKSNFVLIDKPEWRKAKAATSAAADGSGQAPAVSPAAASSGKPISATGRIMRMQTLLARMGYDVGKPDGRMGNRTANAIRLFQLQAGLPVNGQPTPQVLEMLEKRFGSGSPKA